MKKNRRVPEADHRIIPQKGYPIYACYCGEARLGEEKVQCVMLVPWMHGEEVPRFGISSHLIGKFDSEHGVRIYESTPYSALSCRVLTRLGEVCKIKREVEGIHTDQPGGSNRKDTTVHPNFVHDNKFAYFIVGSEAEAVDLAFEKGLHYDGPISLTGTSWTMFRNDPRLKKFA